ncbi:MAG: hypothetical protein IJP65_08720 [Bacteroidales bacterium]|nr:hypothetical protein [Bacteroidales bacterium]
MKKLIMILLTGMMGVTALFAQQKAAVYVTEGSSAEYAEVAAAAILRELNFDGTYTAVERTDDFVRVLFKEMGYQRGGAVDDSQIARAGNHLGVDVVVAVQVTTPMNSVYINARIINVESAKVISSGTASVKAADLDVESLEKAAKEVAKKLLFLD